MAKKNEVAKQEPGALARPEYISSEQTGLADLNRYIRPPRLKIVQPQAMEPYDSYPVGSTLVVPQMQVVAEHEQEFHFTPILFFVEWGLVNPLDLKGRAPMIAERTQDPNDELAKRAQNREQWFNPHPDYPDLNQRVVEFLNFVTIIHTDELEDVPVVMSFSKGEHSTGTSFGGLIKMRRSPIFAGVYSAVVGNVRKNEKGKWHGFDIRNPAHTEPWVDQETYGRYEKLHNELRALVENVVVDYEDETDQEPVTERF